MHTINLSLSLARQLEMERDRRAAARMSRDQLSVTCDELIQAAHMQRHLITELQRCVGHLQVELALAGPPQPSKREPGPEHYAMARALRPRWWQRFRRSS
jgi:hypothetical protein